MNVHLRTFCDIVLSSFALSWIGLLLDADHLYYEFLGVEPFLIHYDLRCQLVYSVIMGVVVAAFVLRFVKWDRLEDLNKRISQ